MTTKRTADVAQVGDWVEARGIPGNTARRGQIVELLGREGHEHFRVRWDEGHESILYPADGVIILPRPAHGVGGAPGGAPANVRRLPG